MATYLPIIATFVTGILGIVFAIFTKEKYDRVVEFVDTLIESLRDGKLEAEELEKIITEWNKLIGRVS